MPFKRSAMRYGHIVGYTSVAYQDDGERILSIGHDGDIRIWDGVFDDDPVTTCVAENVWAMLQYGDRVLIANDLNTVQAYRFPGLEKDGIDFRFTAFVTSLVRNERFIVAGSEDGMIKVKPADGEGDFELSGSEGPVLSAALSVKDLLAAACGDGKLRIWDLKSKELVKTFDGLRKVKSFEGNVHFATPCFEPVRGNVLAYPKGNQIVVLNTATWEQQKVLKHSKFGSDFTCCAFSPRGDFFAAGSDKGEIGIWEYKAGEILDGEIASIDPYPITGLAWNPKNNGELVICDDQGQLGNVNDIFLSDEAALADDGNDLIEMAEKEANGISDDDEDMEINDIYSKHVADKKLLADDSDDENSFSVSKLKSQYATNYDDLNSEILSNKAEDVGSRGAANDEDAHSVMSDRIGVKSYPMQDYFQSGSTPDHLEHRYLVYNHVGIVRAHSDDKENSIEVEFHDSQKHHGIHLNNYLNHTMAGLSETVLAMACTSGVEEKGSKLVCINLVAFGNREWSCTMPGTEEIIGVVASDKIVVVATDCRLLRIFTARGTQREVISVPGPLVSMAAYGDHVLVAYHRSPPNEDQQINLMLITCVKFKLRCREVPIPLTAGAEMRWLGYTDKGSPVVYDSAGIMRLYQASANLWFPILDAEQHKAGASDSLFIVNVCESVQQVQLIVCRGAKFPLTNPRPIPMNANFQQPMCDVDFEKGTLEDELVRSIYLKSDEADKILKETAVKLFALACRSEMEQRARELVETIGSSQLIPIVIKYASKIKRFHLADSLAPLLPSFQQQEKEQEEQEMEIVRENAAIVSELEHINLEAVIKKDNTPKIKPMPMVMRKNNPFRKNDSASKSSAPISGNPLGHLTSKAIGFDSPSAARRDESNGGSNISGVSELTADGNNGLPENNENQSKNSNGGGTPSGMKFLPWFESNKDQLKKENPDVNDAELIKVGMRQFKTLNSYSQPRGSSEKRKLEDGEKNESGVAKLAKFGFTKQ
ncbi:WD repeat and HMG-box DNA-binding protein 1 [Malaya genurostris]|uniref:WD repeat and HMG-box DNA-binding protein 1 n=1 Tax=Malaya genurostris TaxID=325434 RepID=UPI0026F39BAD|nr:WD repeat and HMG-box DNA-binding protein 1 [Malaya genurostris]